MHINSFVKILQKHKVTQNWTITFDLQQSLPTTLISVNVVYYKRQLWTYNFGVHCCAIGTGFMNVWDESVHSRGSQKIGSCVLTYLREHKTPA